MASAALNPPHLALHPLPLPFSTSSSLPLELIAQGAESLLFRTPYLQPNRPCALKYRPPKPYRHPLLDRRLTRQRLLAEARALARCAREGGSGLDVPAVIAGDWDAGWLVTEWIPGRTIRAVLDEELRVPPGAAPPEEQREEEAEVRHPPELRDLMRRIGRAIACLHAIDLIHGDLTTSNLMLREPATVDANASRLSGSITLIDFGLATTSIQAEDKAVDLYVLERAFAATHPRAEGALFGEVLRAYGEGYAGGSGGGGKAVLRRLEEVRARGRKRSMLG